MKPEATFSFSFKFLFFNPVGVEPNAQNPGFDN